MVRHRSSWKMNRPLPSEDGKQTAPCSEDFSFCSDLMGDSSSEYDEELQSCQRGRRMEDAVAASLRLQEEENEALLRDLQAQVSPYQKYQQTDQQQKHEQNPFEQTYKPPTPALPREFKIKEEQDENDDAPCSYAIALELQEEENRIADEMDSVSSSDDDDDDWDFQKSIALVQQLEMHEASMQNTQQKDPLPSLEADPSLALAMRLQQEEEEQIKELERQRAQAEEESMKLAQQLQREEDIRRKDQKLEDKKAADASAELARRLEKEERERKKKQAEMDESKSLEAARRLQQKLEEEGEQPVPEDPWEDKSKELVLLLEQEEVARRKALQEQAKKDEEEAAALAKQMEEEAELERQKSEEMSVIIAQKLQNEEVFSGPKNATASKETVLRELEPCQRKALKYVESQASQEHQSALVPLYRKAEAMGYNRHCVDRCLSYIRNDVPIIIHLKEHVLKLLTQDTHYRNLFETDTSGGSNNPTGRRQWETTLFGGAYEENGGEGSLRPKYGCLNMTGDVRGCERGRYYGPFFITLKKSVRHRCTLFDTDSGGRHETLATCDHYAHVLNRYHSSDLQVLLDVSTSEARRIGGASSSGVATYKEVQIHGPIELAKDIEALSVAGSYSTASEELRQTVVAFQNLTACNVIWQEDMFE
eukprot:CAMPEP_0168785270 /NCGR_PEP_ID=MMETSP0725-20121227/10661_1 /TAXON_ID=265536 /ORGANISM="Amphiprora sp., Strain CCMP467" /LENGTH=650 /DNA_ID=CAMNT_0008835365 /DNA_START=53 /DNA_END=2005 /DNA_ORIENTATION=+